MCGAGGGVCILASKQEKKSVIMGMEHLWESNLHIHLLPVSPYHDRPVGDEPACRDSYVSMLCSMQRQSRSLVE